ncbi:4Fe-4S dicluster domain-containing protein [Beijerinckia indica]|uniref:4Fe-4S ferredoxin iron-sulfur binding domain protein n=1 Tax=Beijerinckia indica subsp. indica (strain ATCC 9039 / DSM 1715 / NCIMB 8712) TaxID=395963 RepID=B2IBL9_BEII9|nr:ferredoxin family protein [Beijerinckia indica]ACB96645.1 4Fe-4S ferredoxin iron-sulfur binding domain protein [Beijerinckia indica subsp. indica ATCC 9039]
MIVHIFEDLCTGCNACVAACPTHVLDPAEAGRVPLIARQDQCQTCFMCELYCEKDAIYVGPIQQGPEPVDPELIRKSGLLGQLRRDYEWDAGPDDPAPLREFWRLGPLLMEGAQTAEKRYEERHPESAALPPR